MNSVCFPFIHTNFLRHVICISNKLTFHSYHHLSKKEHWNLSKAKSSNCSILSKSFIKTDFNTSKVDILTSYKKIKNVVQEDFLEFNGDIQKVQIIFINFCI